MDRRAAVVWVVTGGVMMVTVLAASSGPVQIWVNPTDANTRSVDPARPRTPSQRDVSSDTAKVDWGWLGVVFDAVGVVLSIGLVALFVMLASRSQNPLARWRPRRLDRRRGERFQALPERQERELTVDMEAARAALSGGTPRNAIVGCWMHLEADAERAGLPRMMAETSTQYVARVVASASIDPGPIGELAALYREARFSHHDLEDEHRTRALAALHRVGAALDHPVGAAR